MKQLPGEREAATERSVELPIDVAREQLLAAVSATAAVECVPADHALGRVLAKDLVSPIDVPPHDNSAMDGFALRFADLSSTGPTRLRLAGTAYAGRPYVAAMPPECCVRVMTGALMPAAADTVVMQEVVTLEGEGVIVPAGQRFGQHRRRVGEDLPCGALALAAGKLIGPVELGLLASLGITHLDVRRRLRVATLSTGDELCQAGVAPRVGQIYDCNRLVIGAMLARLGCEVLDHGIVPDEPNALHEALSRAAGQADAVVTSGGVSLGEADHIRSTLASLGELTHWKLAVKPGRPFAFGRLGGGTLLFGLPGNPVAALVVFTQLLRPALMRLMGVDPLPPTPEFQVLSASALRVAPGRTEFRRGILEYVAGNWQVRPISQQGAGNLSSLAEANCFIVLRPESGDIPAGAMAAVQPLDGLI